MPPCEPVPNPSIAGEGEGFPALEFYSTLLGRNDLFWEQPFARQISMEALQPPFVKVSLALAPYHSFWGSMSIYRGVDGCSRAKVPFSLARGSLEEWTYGMAGILIYGSSLWRV